MAAQDIIAVKVTGLDAVEREFDILPGRLRAELRTAVARSALRVQLRTKKDKLSGQVLRVKHGRLIRSINVRSEETPDVIAAQVGTNVEYARIHEFGFKGVVNVREHLRKAKGAFKATVVGAHPRNVDMPQRSFLRSALEDAKQDIGVEILGALARSLEPLK